MIDFAAIIQARIGSTRLPGKVMLEVNNQPLIYHLIKRLKFVKNLDSIIVATTTEKKDDIICDFLKKKKIKFFRGSENNVVDRFLKASKKYDIKNIVHVTADCPLIDPHIVSQVIETYKSNNFDYVSNSNIRTYPDGMDVHVFSFKALKRNIKFVTNKLEKEHVTLGIKNRPKKFKIKTITSTKNLFLPQLGLTLDEKDDFKLIKKIILYFEKKKNYFFSCKEIIHLLKKKKKNWMKINHHVVRKGDT